MKNDFFKIINDSRLTSHHVSLYLALFTKYLEEGVEFEICPQQVMKQAKIRTRETYAHCLNQLNNWGYLVYSPGTNQHLKSKVKFATQENHTGRFNNSTDYQQDNSTTQKNR